MLEHKHPHCNGESQVGCLLLSARFGWIICSCSVSFQLWEQSSQKEVVKRWERECKCLKFGCLLQWVVCKVNRWGWQLLPGTLERCLPREVFAWKAAWEPSAVTSHRGRGQDISHFRKQCVGESPEQLALFSQAACLEQCHILCFVQSHPRPWAIGNTLDCTGLDTVYMTAAAEVVWPRSRGIQTHLHRNPRNKRFSFKQPV